MARSEYESTYTRRSLPMSKLHKHWTELIKPSRWKDNQQPGQGFFFLDAILTRDSRNKIAQAQSLPLEQQDL